MVLSLSGNERSFTHRHGESCRLAGPVAVALGLVKLKGTFPEVTPHLVEENHTCRLCVPTVKTEASNLHDATRLDGGIATVGALTGAAVPS